MDELLVIVWLLGLGALVGWKAGRWSMRRYLPEVTMPYRHEWTCPVCGHGIWLQSSDPSLTITMVEDAKARHICGVGE